MGKDLNLENQPLKKADLASLSLDPQPAIEKWAEYYDVMRLVHAGDSERDAIQKLHPEFNSEQMEKYACDMQASKKPRQAPRERSWRKMAGLGAVLLEILDKQAWGPGCSAKTMRKAG